MNAYNQITPEMIQEDMRYLQLLSRSFPTIAAASSEIINLEAIVNLPKGTEHFLADLHGEYEAFQHVLRNASGAIKRKVKELFGENTGTPVEPVQPVVSEPVAFSATYKQKRQALCNALDPIIVKDENGNYVEETYYYVEDFSDEWVYVEKSHWTVDNYEYKFGRFSYEFDETAMTVTLTSDFEEMVKVWLTLEEKENLDKERAGYELMKTEFEQYKSEYTVTNAEFEELKSYKETKIAEERANAETELFAKYEGKIGETNEFKTLKEKASEYTLDALTKECLCIVGMYSMTSEPTETPKDNKDPLKFSVEQPVQEDEPYGGLMKKYLGR